MNPLTRNLLFAAGLEARTEEYLGTYRFKTPAAYNSNPWIVPAGVTYLRVLAWGSGAHPDGFPNGAPGGNGGSGGFSQAVLPVTEGETLQVGVGRVGNNGGASKTFGGSGGGFSSVFRGSIPLIIAGGGGGGQVNAAGAGGAGGGTNGEDGDSFLGVGTQTSSNGNGSYLTGGTEGGGGGYYGGGGGGWYQAASGGSGYVNAAGNIFTQTLVGSRRTPPATGNVDYITLNSTGGLQHAYGGIGNDSGVNTYGSGLVIIHALGQLYNPSSSPTIPNPRNILATY